MASTVEPTAYAHFKHFVARSPASYANARIALNVLRYVFRKPHEEDFNYLRHAPQGSGLLLDIGANNGMSAFSLRIVDRRSRILSIEPNASLEPSLRLVRKITPRFEFRIFAAGAERGEFTLYTPAYRGTLITGEASLQAPRPEDVVWLRKYVHDLRPQDFTVHEQRVAVIPLDELDLHPSFVKIDVEGAELDVLRGLRATLERHHPVVMIERSGGFPAVTSFMHHLGFAPHTYDTNLRRLVAGVVGDPLNVFFVHLTAERP